MSNIEFKWNIIPQKSIFEGGIPTKEHLDKYGILNIIDWHFDGSNKTPYDLENGSSQALNSFLLNAWDFLKNVDASLVDAYCGAAMDAANYLLALSRYKKRRYYLSNTTSNNKQKYINEAINSLYNYYTNRKNFRLKNKIDQRFGYEDDYKINVYIVQGKKQILVKDGNSFSSAILDKRTQTYFEYYIDSDFYVDLYNEPTSSLFVLFELFNAIAESLSSWKDGSYHNIYEEYLKLYFYKRLTEKYRTKEIEEETRTLIKKTDFDKSKIIPVLYGKLDGKNGTLKSPNITVTSKNIGFNSMNYIVLPFYRSVVQDGILSIYIDKWQLPNTFNPVKQYSSVKNYIEKDTSFFKKIFNDTKELIVDEKLGLILSDDNLYSVARDYVNENLVYLTELKIKELTSLVTPYFDKNYNYLDETAMENADLFIREYRKDLCVNDILFGEENYLGATHYFARLMINVETKNNLQLGSGHIKIQQKTVYGRDNQVTNFVTSEPKDIKVFDGKNIAKYEGKEAKKIVQELKHKEYFETITEYETPEEFETTLEDKEVTVLHINKSYDVPSYKVSKITTDGYKYYLDVSKFYLYNKIENIKQIEILDNETKNEYFFNVIGVKENVTFEEDAYLLLSSTHIPDMDYIFDDTLYAFIANGINSGELKVERTTNGNNEIVIHSEATGLSTVVGNTLIIGKEYEVGIINNKQQYITITEDDDGDYCLELSEKDLDNKLEVVESYNFIVNKQLIIDKTEMVNEYLNKIPIGEDGNVVFILSFLQQSGGAKIAYLDDYIVRKPTTDDNDLIYSWEIINEEFKS